MAGTIVHNRMKALSIEAAAEVVERHGGDPERMLLVRRDRAAGPEFAVAVLVGELARIVDAQQEQIAELRDALDARSEGVAPRKAAAKK
jgi:hypothetical protein